MVTVRTVLALAVVHNWHLFQIDVNNAFLHGNNLEQINGLKKYFGECFKLKDLWSLEILSRNRGGSLQNWNFLSQRKYALEILEEAGFLGAKPCNLPMEPNLALSEMDGELISDPSSYRRLVGKLIYLTITRPDLAYEVHTLSNSWISLELPTWM
ncbi:uncharacterized mitochondrial protein AtMg00810-like [Malania oleifera]|uniref:uncharacterized mitochondrial protein AtMg00810-like n=1 Tax=Malania oleifera TaxID=397392 RepID=UPI0025ADE617|nr:uncharacterized mitochondrial protein AtMg00810-like [Malania oleifera]